MGRVIAGALATCWILLALTGEILTDRQYWWVLGATMSATIHVSVRGRAWYAAYGLGQAVSRRTNSGQVQ
nr:hypothetical protein [Micromonospora sp. DSM 115978]